MVDGCCFFVRPRRRGLAAAGQLRRLRGGRLMHASTALADNSSRFAMLLALQEQELYVRVDAIATIGATQSVGFTHR